MENMNELLPKEVWQMSDVTMKLGEYMSNPTVEGYECLVRRLSEKLYGKHYSEESAMRDVFKMHYTDASGKEYHGPHWTVEQVESVTTGKQFPDGTTKYDKFVAYNAFYADLCKVLPEEHILKAAYAFWFADEDWKGEGKIWEYMSMNK
jgi:hypothetical protein